MAGGMDRAGTPRPAWLTEHHREATRPLPSSPPPAERLEPAAAPERAHCWVLGPPEAPGPWPGLVVHWRRLVEGWVAQVVYVVDDDGPVVITAWVAAEQLRPA